MAAFFYVTKYVMKYRVLGVDNRFLPAHFNQDLT